MITECPNCEFYVRENEEICPDCSLISPGTDSLSDEDSEFYKIQMSYFLGLTVLAGFAGLYFRIHENLLLSFLIAAFPAAVISLFLSHLVAERKVKSKRKMQFSDSPKLLSVKEDKLTNAMFELDERKSILAKELEKDEKNKLLLEMSEIINLQQILCDLQRNKIEIVRLENEILPFIEDSETLIYKQIKNGIGIINNILNDLSSMRESVEEIEAERILPEKNSTLEIIKKSKLFCRTKRENLRKSNKNRGVRKSPKSKNSKTVSIELYNSEPILPQIFEDLENEYHLLNKNTDTLKGFSR